MKKILLGCLLSIITTSAMALDRLNWSAVETSQDGSSVEIEYYSVSCEVIGNSRSIPTLDIEPIDTPETQLFIGEIADSMAGTYNCYVTAVDTNALESDPSNTVKFLIDKAGQVDLNRPNKVNGLSVE